jgi:hypothetical protein
MCTFLRYLIFNVGRGQFLTYSLGVNFDPQASGSEPCPFVCPSSLLNIRKCPPLGVNIPPRDQNSPLGAKLTKLLLQTGLSMNENYRLPSIKGFIHFLSLESGNSVGYKNQRDGFSNIKINAAFRIGF